MIPWWSTEFGGPEIERVGAAIRGRHISQGKVTREFEERLAERLGVPYVVCTTSGTTALTMALMAVGIKGGDEVIVPNRTWIATAHAVMMAGGKVRLADTERSNPLIDIEDASRRATSCQAIVPVNLGGRLAQLPGPKGHLRHAIVIEDSAQAFPQPPRGDIACYSLSTAKIIATGQGGFCATHSEALYKEMRALRTHDVADAMVPQVLQWRRFGYNFRFTDIQAAIGLEQLKKLDARISRLREINSLYRSHLAGTVSMLSHGPDEIPLYNEILLPDLETQESVRSELRAAGVEARPFYPLLHTAPYLKAAGAFPNAERFAYGLVLPSGPCQRDSDILAVCAAVNESALEIAAS